jgi:para-aminobenzoate synthetase component 1
MQVIFDQGPLKYGTLFEAPLDVLRANTPDQVPAVFAAIEKARTAGKWLAGYASYELGLLLQPKLAPLYRPSDTPLI